MVEGWEMVFSSTAEFEAKIILELLEKSGLHPVILNRRDNEFQIGDVEVYVAPEEKEQAETVIGER